MLPNFNPLDLSKFPAELRQPMMPVEQAIRRVREMLQGQLSLRDNQNAALLELDMVHGREKEFKNPLRGLPIGFTPIYGVNSSTGALVSFGAWSGPNLARTDGMLGVTVEYAPPPGEISLYKSANQSIGTASFPVAATWDSYRTLGGVNVQSGGLSLSSNSRIVCAYDGIVQLGFTTAFECVAAPAVSKLFSTLSIKNGSTADRRGSQGGILSDNVAFLSSNLTGVALWEVSATNYLEVIAYQNSGGALNLRGSAAAAEYSSAWARYVAPPPNTAGRVLGILWGA